MATIVFFVFLASVVSLYVIFPIVQAKTRLGNWQQSSNHHVGDLVDRKEAIYAAIKDIEFDFEMGKLSKEDYEELRQRYKNDAVKLLKKIDEKQMKAPKDGKSRSQKGDTKANFCWICGTALIANDKFCANCGNEIQG